MRYSPGFWPYPIRASYTRGLANMEIMVTHRKPPFLRDMLVRAKIPWPNQKSPKICKRTNSCQYCYIISRTGTIVNHHNRMYSTITSVKFQSISLISCLECNICNIKYLGQTRNRIRQVQRTHVDIKYHDNTTVARHFASHNWPTNPKFTIHILKYIRLPKDMTRPHSLRDKRELT